MLSRFFTPKPDSSTVESNREEIDKKIELVWLDGCEYIQKFSGSRIVKYYTTVAVGQWNAFKNRYECVSDKYGISPFEVKHKDGWYHLTYLFAKPLSKKLADAATSNLGQLLDCDMQYWSFFKGYDVVSLDENNCVRTEHIELLSKYFWEDRTLGDSINDQLVGAANMVPAKSIIETFGRNDDYDEYLNIIIGYGSPFQYVMSIKQSLDDTLKFFNEHYAIGFKIQDVAIDTYFVDGIIGQSFGLVQHLWGYAVESEKGMIRITDFLIRVHYKIKKKENTIYAISLINASGQKTPIFQWSNTSSEAGLTELVQSQGNFHFLNPTKKYLIQVHAMISSTDVPTIYSIDKFGRNTFMGNDIVVYANWVFDIQRKIFFPKSDDVNFYFLDGTDGFCVEDERGSPIDDTTKWVVPSVKNQEVHTYDEYLDIFQKMYKDHTGDFLIMVCMTYMGYALYSEENVQYNPIFCGHGVTGSGKTTFAEFVKMLLGIDGMPVVFGAGTTNFALLKMLGSINKFPIMCSEYRASTTDGVGKEAIFRSLYDRKPIAKGNVSQTITSYNLLASMFLEWEELPTDGAVRSRFIHKRLAKRFRNVSEDIDIGTELSSNKNIIESFVNSYQIVSNKDIYTESLVEAKQLFSWPKKEPRIVDNLSMMYASCMAFDPYKRDYFISVLEKISTELHADLSDNGTGMQILKAISMYLSTRWSNLYINKTTNTVIIPWVDVVSYIQRHKIELTLKIESYEDHLVEMGFEDWVFEVEQEDSFGNKEEMCVRWFSIHISKAPKELLVKKEAYSLYKSVCKK